MVKVTEKHIKKQIKDYLNCQGWFNFPVMQGMGSYPGISDRIAIKDGIVLFIEIKRPNGKLSEHQKRFKHEVEYHCGNYIVVRDVDDLKQYMYTEFGLPG